MRIWIFLALITTGCAAEHEVFSVESKHIALEGVSFGELRKELFEPYCVHCHQQYAESIAVRASLMSVLDNVKGGNMPPDQILPTTLIDRLVSWAVNGTPD